MTSKVTFGNRTLGDGHDLYFIADIGANHDGDLNRALELIEVAKEAGADAAKFQNFQASLIVSKKGFEEMGGKLSHQSKWKKSVFEVYEDASISQDWTPLLKKKCMEVGIDYFTSPYDFSSVDHVDPFVDVYKIGSGDITWIEMLEYIARKNKPVMLATGASTAEDVERAMAALKSHTDKIVLMQCNTNYTGSLENFKYVNLNVLKNFAKLYPDTVLGLSDHTPGHATVLGALALGARVFEKHFTDDNHRDGPDHPFAMNPKSWREMVDRSRELYLGLGDGIKRIEENELQASVVQRRCLRVTRDLAPGDVLTAADLYPTRPIPAGALPPYEAQSLIGKRISRGLEKDSVITLKDIQL